MQARNVEVGQSQRQPVILKPLGYRHPSLDSLVTSACLQTNDHSRRLVVQLDILRDTPDEVVGCASLVHIMYHSTVTHEQTTHAVTHRKARDNSELTWVSWVRWSGKWRAREAAYPVCLPATLRILDLANLFCNMQCTTVCITAPVLRVVARYPLGSPDGVPQREARPLPKTKPQESVS